MLVRNKSPYSYYLKNHTMLLPSGSSITVDDVTWLSDDQLARTIETLDHAGYIAVTSPPTGYPRTTAFPDVVNIIGGNSGGSVPTGGTAGQVLQKLSDTEGDADWVGTLHGKVGVQAVTYTYPAGATFTCFIGTLTAATETPLASTVMSLVRLDVSPIVSCVFGAPHMDVSAAGMHNIIWNEIADNLWDFNDIALPAGIGMTYDDTTGEFTLTESGTWAITVSADIDADPTWDGYIGNTGLASDVHLS